MSLLALTLLADFYLLGSLKVKHKILEDSGKGLKLFLQNFQGVLTAVVHILNRSEIEATRKNVCQKLCDSLGSNNRYASESYKATVLNSIEKLCAPKDSYEACIYHTARFNIDGSLD